MSSKQQLIDELLSSISQHKPYPENTAHMEINGNKVLNSVPVEGLHIDTEEIEEGIHAKIRVDKGTKIENDVHLCFGVLPETGVQRIELDVEMEEGAEASFLAHCTFPNAKKVQHIMNARIHLGPHAHYDYFERHVHGDSGGIEVIPKAEVHLDEGARFKTEFELIKGRVGKMDIDYTTYCAKDSSVEMTARIHGQDDDVVKIKETGVLEGENSRGVLVSNIALQDSAYAEVYNDLTAKAPYAKGHVDCKEIVQDNAVARAIPIVQVNHPLAHVTHEAAIGSVDSKQLQTLMSRGMSEEDAVDLIIQGLLRGNR